MIISSGSMQSLTPAMQIQLEAAQAAALQQAQLIDGGAAGSVSSELATPAIREQQMEARLQKLSALKFDRLPASMLEAWYKSESDENADLPPAPPGAFLYSDVRFKAATERLQKDFTLGNWEAIAHFFEMIPEENAKTVYRLMLTAASGANARQLQGAASGGRVDPRTLQPQYLSFDDIFSIGRITPEEIEKTLLPLFSAAFKNAISRGNLSDDLIVKFNTELEESEPVFTKRQIAKILFGAGLPIPAGEFLPDLDVAQKENDHEALNLLSQHYLAIYQKDKKNESLEQAWRVTQAILASKDVDAAERKLALQRAVKLSTDVNESLGQKWLNESFVAQPETGMEVLGAIGADIAKSIRGNSNSPDIRLERLKLQNDAVNALLSVSEEQARKWREQLELLAINWLQEASISYTDDTSTQIGPRMNRDVYGNIFYFNQSMNPGISMRNGMVSAIKTSELLELKPSEEWLELINPTLRPKFDTIMAQLYLKVSEQDLALPYIEKLAATHPEKAEALVDEFLRVWTTNHNPNSVRQRTNSYMFMYGFESRAEGIPLTRSKQQRNLAELGKVVKRLDGLVEKELDEDLLVKAFFACHSTAEVYKLKEIEHVFGPIGDVNPKTIAALAARMRTNLAALWRDANVQKDKKTKRKKKEIEQEVVDGYALARKLVEDSLVENAQEWTLINSNAQLVHDENNYRAELENSTEFSQRRKRAMELFQQAAAAYAAKVVDLEEEDYSTGAFDTWYYASLGACDLNLITEKHRADRKQAVLIRAAILALPGPAAEWHMDRFANLLFNRMSSVKPQLKHKYLDVGFEIVGDHKQAAEAKKVHDYYKDLVSEIQLEAVVDGDARVGHDAPFGVQINLKHTKEIERESGGFGRYLQNQNSSQYFSYNYGRPTEDYRDKFEEMIREAYSEQFEVVSITFEEPDVKSIPAPQDGWRITPYAYLLLKARGPQVDQIPSAHLDLDFLDTSGYAILPIESPPLLVDASERIGRPFDQLSLTQILDERQWEEGKLVLEIKATALGLVPDLDEILNLDHAEFEVTDVTGPGVSVAQFSPDEKTPTIKSERNWLVTFEAKTELTNKPATFEFPLAHVELDEAVFQRYVDADLATVGSTVDLEQGYGKTSYTWMIYTVVAVVIGGLGLLAFMIWMVRHSRKAPVATGREIDDDVSPFVAISLLQEIHAKNGLSNKKRDELAVAIGTLEARYFGQSPDEEVMDLVSEVRKWVRQAK